MKSNEKFDTRNYCVILAGGKGRRLWPCSRESYPKQFMDFFGVGRSQLQQTYDRISRMIPRENIYVNTNERYASLVREQLPDLADDHLLAEPVWRNTAPSVIWAAHRISRTAPEARIIVTPSDQAVIDEAAFQEAVLKGLQFVGERDAFLTLGVKPTRPEPGYGYIQLGEEVEEDLFGVRSFTEKPERDFARMFMESGEFYWNTGIYLSNINYLRATLGNLLPAVLRQLSYTNPNYGTEEENAYIREFFPSYPNLSIDRSVLEKAESVFVMRCNFGWADLGTWHSIYEAMQKSPDDNVVIDSEVIVDDCRGNVVKLPKGKLGIISGLDGYIVAEEENVLLICKKEDSSALVRKYINEVQMKFGSEFL